MMFWIIAVFLALIVAATLARALLRGQGDQEHPAAYDLRVYRDQLKEIDKDLARGVIGAEDADRLRAEVSRRILSADAKLRNATEGKDSSETGNRALALAIALLVLAGGAGLYATIGAPGYKDLPLDVRIANAKERHDSRPSQAEYEAKLPPSPVVEPDGEYVELMTQLRKTVAERPDDLQGQILLARNEANLGNLKAAYTAQEAVLRLKGEEATVQDYMLHAELLINAAEGYISPEAEASLRAVRQISPGNKVVRYYWGLMLIQNDRPDLAFRIWERLLAEGPANAPWIPVIRARMEELAWRAGVKYSLPPAPAAPALKGPSAEDMDAASEMSDEDQQAMIEGMVAQLGERLATEGGTPQEWSQLLVALGVLGRTEQAAAIWGEAQTRFKDHPAELDIVRGGARRAGVAE